MTAAGIGTEAPADAPVRARLVGPDVTRAVALIGVVVMNYHGYLNGSAAAAQPGDQWAAQLFDPWTGVLSTRFASTFMLVAGVGVALLTERAAAADRAGAPSSHALDADRWRLVRRGTLLYGFGFVLDWIWPGTILFYYGAAFVIAALIVPLRSRWIASIGATAALAAAALNWWAVARGERGESPAWLLSPGTLETRSPRGLVLDTFVNGTHPMLPWLAFMCAGIVLGRRIRSLPMLRTAAIGAGLVAATYVISHIATSGHADDPVRLAVFSTSPFDRGLLYTLNALGSAVAAFCVISWLTGRHPGSLVVRVLQVAGQTTLSLYVLHVLYFNLVVNTWYWVTPTGLDTALALAITFWAAAITLAWWWRRRFPLGPLEVAYRRFGG